MFDVYSDVSPHPRKEVEYPVTRCAYVQSSLGTGRVPLPRNVATSRFRRLPSFTVEVGVSGGLWKRSIPKLASGPTIRSRLRSGFAGGRRRSGHRQRTRVVFVYRGSAA